ncbi:hypothetical protein ID852_15725 [Xenorhabdus sp. 42]|uniref:hypothetical protein n=1 Tax=Xenorhabdus szentirmaii TaxID=290112 RepID=UPI00199CDD76|nr:MULTISPECIES: hypothetical protein [unclassified Xenorhabdus]MBD2794367.1 hypothetical protein [Xenorhabdus sp. CUL]MBD2822107.1 hypothetical protein [Xenorhabdus sp. 42]MBD2827072.1 hypothetical protein [Xenorhabdus sp. 5]
MVLYEFYSSLKSNGDIIDINDSNGRLSSYFIWNNVKGDFLNFMKPRCQPQSSIKLDDLLAADYLPANMEIPIFSEKAMNAFKKNNMNEIKGFECIVNCGNRELIFYMCFIDMFLDLVDIEKSEFRELTTGRKVLTKAVYKQSNELDFYLARDINFKGRLVLSQKFVDFCFSNNLNINFLRI